MTIQSPGILSHAEAERLLAIGDGDAALLLLYARQNNLPWPEHMPGFSPERLHASRALLRDAGLLFSNAAPVAKERPNYRASEIASCGLTDAAFAHVVKETERLLGKPLSSQDLQILYSMYDWRGFSPGVLLLLVHYCIAESERRYGAGVRLPSIRQIDREAAAWEQEGLFSETEAEEYIRKKDDSLRQETKVYQSIGVFPRQPSPTEKKYVALWLSLGFDYEAIALAYDKTVTATGKMAWAYCHKILTSWHEQGLHRVSEIESKGQKPSAKNSPGSPLPSSGQNGLDHTRRVLERIKNK